MSEEKKARAKGQPYEVGHGKPPREHQWKKGQSGNWAGRPPRIQRYALPEQLNKDILERLNRPMKIKTSDGDVLVPTILAMMEVQIRKGLNGHAPNWRFIIGLYERALKAAAAKEPEAEEGILRSLDHIANGMDYKYPVAVINDAANYLDAKYVAPEKRRARRRITVRKQPPSTDNVDDFAAKVRADELLRRAAQDPASEAEDLARKLGDDAWSAPKAKKDDT